ncbi:MAG TPA: DUF72 domain-containing protein [Candidatus Limnocylindrales bacterium]
MAATKTEVPISGGGSGVHDPGVEVARERSERVARDGEPAVLPIQLPGAGEIRVGTASWTDPTMTVPGVFYPVGTDTAEERLGYYAGRFPVVEVDATYYALPSERTSALWVDRTPPDFTFDIKAHALMTGQPTETKRLPKGLREELPDDLRSKPRVYGKQLPAELLDEFWRLFREGLEPLRESGQLGAVFLQYPRWFFTSSENRDAILDAQRRLEGIPVAVEFRNSTWFNEKNVDRTLRFLQDNHVPYVMIDGPQGFKSSVPPLDWVTSPELAVVRFHGRRAETWEAKGVPTVERFRYLYGTDELRDWVSRIEKAAKAARETHVLMNNCYANYGATNAREIAKLLAELETTET